MHCFFFIINVFQSYTFFPNELVVLSNSLFQYVISNYINCLLDRSYVSTDRLENLKRMKICAAFMEEQKEIGNKENMYFFYINYNCTDDYFSYEV